MSKNCKALKLSSFVLFLGAIDLAIVAFVLQGQDPKPELLQTIVLVLAAVLELLLGGFGIGAANRPSRIKSVLPVLLVSMLLTAANLVLSIMSDLAVASSMINAVIEVTFCNYAIAIYKEQQQ